MECGPLAVAHASVDGPTSRCTWAAPKEYIEINIFYKGHEVWREIVGWGTREVEGKI